MTAPEPTPGRTDDRCDQNERHLDAAPEPSGHDAPSAGLETAPNGPPPLPSDEVIEKALDFAHRQLAFARKQREQKRRAMTQARGTGEAGGERG